MTFRFELDATYPKNFPVELDPSEDEHISFQSYEEAFLAAQKAGIPYYVLAVAESAKSADTKKYYHFYHMTHFENYRTELLKTDKPLTDPVTCIAITNIHYFAVKCFEPDNENLFRPIDPSKQHLKLHPFTFPSHPATLAMLRDSLNSDLFLNEPNAIKQQARRTQHLVADFIKNGAVFPNLSPEEKNEEALHWLWCAAKGSHRAIVELFHVSEQHEQMPAAAKSSCFMQLLQTSVIKNPKLPRMEREAIHEARKLVAKW